MSYSFKINAVLIAMILIVSASCNVIQPYQKPTIPTTENYRGQSNSDTIAIAQLPYTEIFRDTILQHLIEEGLNNNLNIKTAYIRITQAEALYHQTKAAFYPTLSGNFGITASKLPEAQSFGFQSNRIQYQLGVSSAWEADIWGRLKSNRKANLAAWLQTDAAAKVIQTNLVSSIANNYYLLLALDKQLLITTQTVDNWDKTVATMKALKQSARVTEAAVVQSEAQRHAAQVTIPDIKRQIREVENLLSVLLARPAGEIIRGSLDKQLSYDSLQTGIPAQLLANRPDVVQAEYAYRNTFELTNIARTAFYPTLNITSSAGLNSLSLSNFLNPVSFAASIGASLVQPIFNRKLNKTNLKVAEAGQQIALLNFQNTLLTAGQEVSNALYLHQTALEKMEYRSQQMTALQKSVEYTEELLKNGFANYNEVIIAKQSLLGAELGKVNDRLQQLQATVNLYRALGGGQK
ncbi:MAG: efflux transporter outer membrane subunit [Sphingobacteriales bacterium]|nr:efflux transporter outer membrane subunit [Sphingobacteriales bacterium]